jgi:hypothetical protein
MVWVWLANMIPQKIVAAILTLKLAMVCSLLENSLAITNY